MSCHDHLMLRQARWMQGDLISAVLFPQTLKMESWLVRGCMEECTHIYIFRFIIMEECSIN